MKNKRKRTFLLLIIGLLIFTYLLSGCGNSQSTKNNVTETASIDYEEEIKRLKEENEELKEELAKYLPVTETTPTESETATEQANVSEETVSDNEVPAEERKQIVVFGDSIWDSARDESGIAAQVANFMNADVYNCAIGGTRATLKDGESPDDYENWDSTSLSGLVNVATGKVDPESFLEGYPAGGVIRNIDFEKTDYFIIAYGLNDYFSGATLNVEGGREWDAHGYGGALRYAIDELRGSFPDTQILLISPTYCQFWKDGVMYTDSNMKDFGGGSLTMYANVCRNVAEMQNTLYIDAYSTMGINIYTADEYLEDGIHLTSAGRELYAKAVSSCLKYGKPGKVSGNSVYY